MRIKITKASDFDYEEIREIEKFEELKQIDKHTIIRFLNNTEKYDAIVTIYDDYVE